MRASSVCALIPARGGSRGVPAKNVRPLSGYPLIAYSIVAAQQSQRIDRVIVSTDAPDIAEVARSFGAEAPFLRPAQLAGDDSPDRDFVLHALDWFESAGQPAPEALVHLRPTTPLRDPAVIDAAIDAFAADPTASSLRSGHEAPESPFKWFTRGETGRFVPMALAGGGTAPVDLNQPRQMFPEVYVPDGYVDVLRSRSVRGGATLHGNAIHGFVTPVSHEIDTPEDLEFLEFQLARHGHPLLNALRSSHPI